MRNCSESITGRGVEAFDGGGGSEISPFVRGGGGGPNFANLLRKGGTQIFLNTNHQKTEKAQIRP